MPDPKEHAENRGWIETIAQYIPGYGGYLKRELRRDADELQREWLADRLQRSKRGLDDYGRTLVDQGRLDEMTQVERLRTGLDKILARIKGAMQGYSGFFDLVKVDEEVLDRVYEHEAAMVEQTAQLADGIEALRDNPAASTEALTELRRQIEAIDDAWDQREDILKGLD